ncbi:MAG: hypothetical protein NT121_25110 [Chloroflexi bacterium]|nr:hypothetical protein [Chloroflexota bacterium]
MNKQNKTLFLALSMLTTVILTAFWMTSVQAGAINLPSAPSVATAVKGFPQLIEITRMLTTMLLIGLLTLLMTPILAAPAQDRPE